MYSVYNRAEVRFEYLEEIGQDGQNSQTFIAHDGNLDAEIVIKQISRKNLSTGDAAFTEDDFFSESRLLYKAAHAHVVQIRYACACEDNIYLALPYYKNGSLKELSKKRQLTGREIIRFAIQICSGLHNIHSKGLIHFDIKPDNILLSDRYEALISDFGLAKLVQADFTATPAAVYCWHVTPEFIQGHTQVTSQHDIYQLGMTLYRLVVGEDEFNSQRLAFQTPEKLVSAILDGKFPSRITLEHIPNRLKTTIENCLKIDLNERYASVLDVANDLALIDDKTLDWVYCNDDGRRTWHKATPTHEYMLTIDSDGVAEAKKKTASGRWSRVTGACGNITKTEIKRFLRSY